MLLFIHLSIVDAPNTTAAASIVSGRCCSKVQRCLYFDISYSTTVFIGDNGRILALQARRSPGLVLSVGRLCFYIVGNLCESGEKTLIGNRTYNLRILWRIGKILTTKPLQHQFGVFLPSLNRFKGICTCLIQLFLLIYFNDNQIAVANSSPRLIQSLWIEIKRFQFFTLMGKFTYL